MRPCWTIFLALPVITFVASAQTASTTSPPNAQVTIKAQALTVIVDVVVTDRHGNPVKNLTKDQFHVLENGSTQQIGFFEEHHEIDPSQAKPLPLLPENVYSNFPTSPVTDSINVLLLDALNTPLKDQLYIRQQMLKYLKQIPPGTRLAIFTLSSRLRMLQGFSADPQVLLAALNSKKASGNRSSLLPDESDPSMSDTLGDMGVGSDPATAGVLANIQQFEADMESFQTDLRVRYTLQAFQQLGAYLSGLKGRKNIIWFSGSFPLGIDADGDLQNPFSAARTYFDDVRKTTDILAINQIAVYPVDGRGLMVPPMFSASQSGSKYVRNPAAFSKDNSKFFQQTAAEHATMDQVANSTGGEALYNTNGLKEAIAHIIHIGSNYYTIAYTPADNKYDGKFRKVKVQIDHPDTKLEYRHGYFADDPNAPQQHSVVVNSNPVQITMRRGGPDATEILFKVRVLPADPQPDLTSESSRDGDNGTKLKGPLVRYWVDWAIDMHNVGFTTTPDGVHHGSLLIATVGYDADGKPLNSESKGLRLSLSPALYSQVMQKGFPYHQELDLPKGEVFLRVGVFDQPNNKAGATEIALRQLKTSH